MDQGRKIIKEPQGSGKVRVIMGLHAIKSVLEQMSSDLDGDAEQRFGPCAWGGGQHETQPLVG